MNKLKIVVAFLFLSLSVSAAQTRDPITYKVTFPEPEHHWMQVEMTVNGLGTAPLRARMSRSSPGRYAVHEFAKNIFFVEAFSGKGTRLSPDRPDIDTWLIPGHDGTVRIVYKIFGDTPDGTYMGVDTTHARMNMPAAFMWVQGQESRPMKITFAPPQGSNWKIATQLFTTSDPWTFTAPNLQYFMDSPTELADLVISEFSVANADGSPVKVRLAAHSDGSQGDVDELAKLVQPMVREHMAVFGEFPKYEPGYYTFLLDYVPWGDGDGMEHRNSTMVSTPGLSLRSAQGRSQALSTISHEYFHNWNVERIRPAGLEPFDFTRENVTCCLWLAEGFTQYYGPLLLRRAGLSSQVPTGNAVQVIMNSGARSVRSAVDMSLHAPFADAGVANDTVDRSRTFISYYTYGGAIALGLDLSLREMSGGKLSLDDYMRLLWKDFGKVPPSAPGLVTRPYTLKDLRVELATLTGNPKFADDFFDKYVEGHDVVDYARLLRLAGYDLRKMSPGKGWAGTVQVQTVNGGLLVAMGNGRGSTKTPVAFDAPLYKAGVDFDDVITTIDGAPATQDTWAALTVKAPGTQVPLGIQRRGGARVTRTLTIEEDPSLTVVDLGAAMTPAQKTFRDAWLASKQK